MIGRIVEAAVAWNVPVGGGRVCVEAAVGVICVIGVGAGCGVLMSQATRGKAISSRVRKRARRAGRNESIAFREGNLLAPGGLVVVAVS